MSGCISSSPASLASFDTEPSLMDVSPLAASSGLLLFFFLPSNPFMAFIALDLDFLGFESASSIESPEDAPLCDVLSNDLISSPSCKPSVESSAISSSLFFFFFPNKPLKPFFFFLSVAEPTSSASPTSYSTVSPLRDLPS